MTLGTKRFWFSLTSVIVASLATWLWIQTFSVTFGDVEKTLSGLRWRWLPLVLGLLVFHVALSAVRWTELEMCLGGKGASFRLGFTSGAIAMGLGTFLPAPAMSVLCRSLANKLAGNSGGRGAASGILDQLCDFVTYAWLAIPAIFAVINQEPASFLFLAPITVALGWPVLLLLSRSEPWIGKRLPSFASTWVGLLISKKTLFRIYAISVLRMINVTAITVLIGLSVQAPISALALSVSVPLVSIANALVMLPGAIGVAEWSFTAVLSHIGTAEQAIVRFVLANRIILTALPMFVAIAVPLFVTLQKTPRGEREAGDLSA